MTTELFNHALARLQQAGRDVDAVLDQAGKDLMAVVTEYELRLAGGVPPVITPPTDPTPTVPAGVHVIELPFGANPATPDGRTWTVQNGGWQEGETLAFHFRTPAASTDGRGICNVSWTVADGGSPAPSQASISQQPGDFDNPVKTPFAMGVATATSAGGGDTRTISFGIGNAPMGEVALQPSTDYYFNVRYTTALFGGNGRAYIAKPGYL